MSSLRTTSAAPLARTSRAVALLAIGVMVLLAIVRSWWGTKLDAVTADEPWHIVAGVEYVRTGNFRLNPEHPPLSKLLVGAMMPERFTLRPYTVISEKTAERDMVEETFFFDNDYRAAQSRARTAMWTLNGTMLLLLGVLLWQACGLSWALVALAFLAIDPTVAAHLPVVMTDLPVALALGIAALGLGLMLAEWKWVWALPAGLGMGLALGAKHSALPGVVGLGAAAVVFACAQWLRSRSGAGDRAAEVGADHATAPRLGVRLAMLSTVAACALLLLWMQYGFHFHAAPDGRDDFNRAMADKIGDLKIESWRTLLSFCDRWQLLPRAYIWGLADTVRAGVEGRGQNMHFLWGQFVSGSPPWYTWPSFIVIKVPLALLALSAVGAIALWRARLTRTAFWAVAFSTVMGLMHLAALFRSQGTYAGARHALPVFVMLAVLAGAVAWRIARDRSRSAIVAAALGLLTALGMTIGERRVWEYHNELVGGTARAALAFGNEGLDLSQRAYEIADFNRDVMKQTGLPVYSDYWVSEEETKVLGLNYSRNVVDLADTNRAGIYDGYFIYDSSDQVPVPDFEWDPAEIFKGLTRVTRLGNVEIWRGRQVVPRVRASSLAGRIVEYVYKLNGKDWALVATRAEEVIAVLPTALGAAVELGNAYVRLGRRADAIRAFKQPLSLKQPGIFDDLIRAELLDQVARLERGDDLATIKPMRNPWME